MSLFRLPAFSALFSMIFVAALFTACQSGNEKNKTQLAELIAPADFEDSSAMPGVKLITLNNGNLHATITNYGGRIVQLYVPSDNDSLVDVIIGHGTATGFKESAEPFYGALIGRFGNRIANGRFTLDGNTYQLPVNNGANTLHGGPEGFHNQVWNVKAQTDTSVTLTYLSKDGEAGFPGNLNVEVTYSLQSDAGLHIAYRAETDKKTVLNLTSHPFFNLNGGGTVLDHELQINASQFTPVDSNLIPMGRHESVEGTPFDFRSLKPIGRDLETENEQLSFGKGYDHNYVLDSSSQQGGMKHAATAIGDKSGIKMDVYTTEPGLQFYGGNFMQGQNSMKDGKDEFRTAFCLETQHFPDSPNQPAFPSTVLNPGEQYQSNTVYRFSRRGATTQ